MSVTDVNDAPTLTATFSNPTFTEDGSAVSLFSGTTVSTIESGQTITSLVLTVDNLLDGEIEMLNVDGTDVVLTNEKNYTTSTNGMSCSVSVTGSTSTVTLTKVGGISTAIMQTLINGITYKNSSQNPTVGNRVVNLTEIQDNGGKANGGVDTTVLSVASTVAVVSVNDVPHFTKGADITVNEDSVAQSIANWATGISAGPADESGQTLSFTVTNDHNDLFSALPAIDANGTLTFTPAANEFGTATVSVKIYDDGGTENGGFNASAMQTFTITITAENDAPSFTKGGDITVLEDCGAQSRAGWATSISAGPSNESGQALSFSASNDNNALFSVQPAVASNGTLTFTPAANANGTATLTVTLHDDGGTANDGVDASASQTFTITITSVNDAPTVINSTKTLDEDTTLTFAAADFTGNYSDAAESSALSTVRIETLPDAGNGKLQLSGVDITATQVVNAADLGNITFVPALNFSGNATFTWKASDGTDYSASSATMTLSVNAVNDAPSDISLSASSINENVTDNSTVGTLSSTDADVGDTFTYTLVTGMGDTDNAAFNISGSSLRITTSPDYEEKNSYSVRIRTTDQGSLSYEKAVAVTINNQNEAPTDIALSSSSVNENVTGNTTVGALSTTDPDASNTYTYSIVSVDGDTTSTAFNIAGNDLRITNSPDFETENSYLVRVLTTDQDGLTFEKAFTITINDQNDAPLITSGAPSSFAENGMGVVYVATGTDPEDGSITWSISGTDAGLFNIDHSTGVLSFKTAPNFESPADSGANNVYDLTITVTDDGTGNLTATKTISITVTNVNEAPIISTNGAISITEGSTTAFTAVGSDPEGSALSWSITGGADQEIFSIVSGTGVVAFKTAPSFSEPSDADAHNDYVLELTASDGTLTGVKAVTVTVTKRPSGGGGSGSSSAPTSTNAVVEVNGQKQDAGTAKTETSGGQTVTTITVDDTKLNKILESKGEMSTVTLPANATTGVVVGELSGQTVKNMEKKEAVLEIKTGTVSYTLPASQINIDAVSSEIGAQVELKDIKVSVKIAEPSADTVKIVEATAKKGSYQLVVKPVDFEISCTSGSKTVEVSKFDGYVERTVAIPGGVDPSKITTGIVLNSDGTFRHVPTTIIKADGKYFAKINSLTNSTYSVIWNPVTFSDVANHWAKDAVNDMGSRMVVTGVGKSTYEPDRSITRAEFAAIVVRALGLAQGTKESSFGDVSQSQWFNGYVDTATDYALITGYDSETFAPNDTITREQAMAILARAMKTTGLKVSLTDAEVSTLLAKYEDGNAVSDYAKAGLAACVKSGVVKGSSASTLSPKAYVTRAEVAVMVQHLLEKSGLI